MAYLIIDAGNTRVKLFVFEGDKIIFSASEESQRLEKIILIILKKYSIGKIILSSVGALQKKITEIVNREVPLILLSHKTKLPFDSLYSTPKTLGVDRIALVCAASILYPSKDVLIVDAGTCVTFDLLNKENTYLGGAISLGLEMRYKALNSFTEKLPRLSFKNPEILIGDSTESCIHSGVVNGFVAEIKGIIEQYELQYPNLTIVLTGGDMNYLSKRLKNSIFANPNFLVEGLNAILKYET
ncbi:type III pantothenate kinase [Flavicella sp.]|uniref:type III pantothenate kinase n=1 Tax=Flavicella sp. TaxID=2957742 RepID=UPI0030167C83